MTKFYIFIAVVLFNTAVEAQVITFNDPAFKAKLLESSEQNDMALGLDYMQLKIDANSNNEIEVSEALAVYQLNIRNASITDVSEIGQFSNLVLLYMSQNQLDSVNLSGLDDLEWLECDSCGLTALDLSPTPNLHVLSLNSNAISSIDVTMLPFLQILSASNSLLTIVDISQNTNLATLNVQNCALTSLDFSNNTLLTELYCADNLLTSLDFSANPLVESIYGSGNDIQSLNISGIQKYGTFDFTDNLLTSFDVSGIQPKYLNSKIKLSNNLLQTLNLKNGWPENDLIILEFAGNPTLEYICGDENELTTLNQKLQDYGNTNVTVNTYCSFVPGGTFYTLQGNVTFDADANGCDVNDAATNNVKFVISGTTGTSAKIQSTGGAYSLALQQGSYTVTPLLEMPSYYTVYPSSVEVALPGDNNPLTHDFCVTLNGTHPDLEIHLIPTIAARPGFDAVYKLVYRNKGNLPQSGSIALAFNDALMDFIESEPIAPILNSNTLTWQFNDLLPFETRTIEVVLNINSPVETPAVNGNDILDYHAFVMSDATDDTPEDNAAHLFQTVVNSFDPNDKTCLEGNTITPDMVGKYIHYMIRFENTGTANAENIVVKDMIDTTKFDVSSLIPLDGSHPFTSRITEINKVEFIFENIQLPFDDANNDGYVAFKIKTLPTLVTGDSFSNTANIYFDYNAPIVTNTATTAIQALSTDDFEFDNHFTLYPNPANDILNIKSKDSTTVNSLSVYNTLGQLILTVTNPQEITDISELASGNYFLKIHSNKGISNTRFIKN